MTVNLTVWVYPLYNEETNEDSKRKTEIKSRRTTTEKYTKKPI